MVNRRIVDVGLRVFVNYVVTVTSLHDLFNH